MVSMAKENDTWVYINESTFKWACEQNLGWQVINAMENRLKNNKIRYEHIKDYEEKISSFNIVWNDGDISFGWMHDHADICGGDRG